MRRIFEFALVLLAVWAAALTPPAGAAPTETRMALVIGNGAYPTGALATAANDAGLIAQTLQAAGFDVVGARDLDEDSLRHAFRDFVDKASKAGPETVAAVYFAGYALQLEGENYLIPVDAAIARDSDVRLHGLRLSDYTHSLAGLGLKATMVVLDAARANPFPVAGQPLASGLALVNPEPGVLVAFNAMPGTVAPEAGTDGYGPYAKALAEMIRQGGLQPADVFARTRLRVNELTGGAQVPWHASMIQAPFVFFELGPDAPPPPISAAQTVALHSRPLRDLRVQDAYLEALSRDTLDGYEDFLAAYPRDPMAKRVRAIVAARREAITWRRTCEFDSPDAYWSYLRRYPRGPHIPDARRRLAELAAAFDPPPAFAAIDYDVPPPPPDEVVYYARPVLVFDDPVFAFAPPPPPPIYFLAPPPPEFVVLAPPPPVIEAYILPVPAFVPVPVYVSAPAYVAPPPNPIIFNNIHNTVVINNTTNVVTITNTRGQVVSTAPVAAPASGPAPGKGVATLTPALPPSVAPKAALINNQSSPTGSTNPAAPGALKQPPTLPGTPAPGTKPLPIPPGASLTPPGANKSPGATPPAGSTTLPATPPTGKPGATPPAGAATLPPTPPTGKPGATPPAGTATLPPTPPAGKPGATPPAGTATLPPTPPAGKPGATPPAGTTTLPATPPAGKLGATPPAGTATLPPTPPAANLRPLDTGKKPGAPQPALSSVPPPSKPTPPVTPPPAPPAAKLAPPAAPPVHEPPPPAANLHPLDPGRKPGTPQPALSSVPPPSKPVTPPPVVHQPPPAPPPAARLAPPPPPPPVVRPPPPPAPPPPPPPQVRQVQAPPPPPPAPPRPAPPPAAPAAKCPVVNGQPKCK